MILVLPITLLFPFTCSGVFLCVLLLTFAQMGSQSSLLYLLYWKRIWCKSQFSRRVLTHAFSPQLITGNNYTTSGNWVSSGNLFFRSTSSLKAPLVWKHLLFKATPSHEEVPWADSRWVPPLNKSHQPSKIFHRCLRFLLLFYIVFLYPDVWGQDSETEFWWLWWFLGAGPYRWGRARKEKMTGCERITVHI